ncbi:MAG: head-tail connector protein [Pseudomonadota bacterium]
MALKQLVAPAAEPISLAEAKAFLRLDTETEDAFVSSLIKTSRLHIEAALDLALITQRWRLTSRVASLQPVPVPLHPVREVVGASAIDAGGASTAIPLDQVDVNLDERPATVCVTAEFGKRVAIDFEAGFGADPADVPEPIRQALLLLVAHWFENREPVVIGSDATRIPMTVSALLAPYRGARL